MKITFEETKRALEDDPWEYERWSDHIDSEVDKISWETLVWTNQPPQEPPTPLPILNLNFMRSASLVTVVENP